MPRVGPTAREVYRWTVDYLSERKRPPTIREVARGLGCSVVTVLNRYHELEAAGHIEREPGIARGLTLTSGRRKTV